MANPVLQPDTAYRPARDGIRAAPARRALAITLAAVAVWVFLFRVSGHMPDFEVYWRAGARAADAEPIYRAEDGHYVFKYLPAFAVLAIPVGLLPQPVAQAVWFFTLVVLLVVFLRQAIRLLPERRKPVWLLVLVLIVVLGKFFGHEMVLGQVNLLLAVVAAGALLAIRSGREALAGALIVLAIVIKPYAVIFLPWLAARGRRQSLIAALLGFACVLALPAAVYGWTGNVTLHQEWWATVTSTTAPNLFVVDNVSLAAAFARILGAGDLAARLAVAGSAALLGLAGAVFMLRRGLRFPEGLEGALLMTSTPLISPQGWDYVFLLSAPAIACLANYEDRLPLALRVATAVAVAAIGLSLFDVMGRAAHRAFMEASMITWLYLVVIGALVTLRARKIA